MSDDNTIPVDRHALLSLLDETFDVIEWLIPMQEHPLLRRSIFSHWRKLIERWLQPLNNGQLSGSKKTCRSTTT